MTRRDFELIAKVIRDLREDFDNSGSDEVSLSLVADAFADALATDHPRFNRERFIKACNDTPATIRARREEITAQLA